MFQSAESTRRRNCNINGCNNLVKWECPTPLCNIAFCNQHGKEVANNEVIINPNEEQAPIDPILMPLDPIDDVPIIDWIQLSTSSSNDETFEYDPSTTTFDPSDSSDDQLLVNRESTYTPKVINTIDFISI